MIRTVVFSSAALLVLLLTPASAEVFERDWQMPGDGLLTYDDVNQREWLDLSVSRLDQFPEPRLDNAIAEIAPGALFEGFTWAKRDDVAEFAQSAGIDTTTSNYDINHAATRQTIDLLGVTLDVPPFVRSLGFIDPTDFAVPAPPRAGANFFVSFDETTGTAGIAGLSTSSTSDFFTRDLNPSIVGVMLWRNVPEPGGEVLGIILLNMLTLVRRRRP